MSVNYLSQYSEEKAKIIRYETLKVETADEEIAILKSRLSQIKTIDESVQVTKNNSQEKIRKMLLFEDTLLRKSHQFQALQSKLNQISRTMDLEFGKFKTNFNDDFGSQNEVLRVKWFIDSR